MLFSKTVGKLGCAPKGSTAVMLAGGTWPWHVRSGGGRRHNGGTGRGAAAVGHGGASGRDRVGQAPSRFGRATCLRL